MKAEEALESAYKIIRDNQSDKHEDVDPPLINAMKKYARIQIEKDREEIIDDFMLNKNSEWANKLRTKPINLD